MLDWIRLIEEPTEDRLADVVSEIDGLSAIGKVEELLGSAGRRFRTDPFELPLPPARHSGPSEHPICSAKVGTSP